MNKKSRLFAEVLGILIVLVICFGFLGKKALAVCDFYTAMTAAVKNVTITTVCTVSGIDGIDQANNSETSVTNTATLTIANGGAVTINANGRLIAGPVNLSGGNVAIQSGGLVRVGMPLYVADVDTDGRPANFNLYDATASGRRRLSLMQSYTTADCDDTNPNVTVGSTYYRDVDGDGYGVSTMTMSSCTPPAGYVANNTDCYDANPDTTNAELAHPGQTSYFTTNRGDGSFDYNCNSTADKQLPALDRATTPVSVSYVIGGVGCAQTSCGSCGSASNNIYNSATIGCGQSGATCIATNGNQGGNCRLVSCGPTTACGALGKSRGTSENVTTGLCSAISTGTQACR